MFSIITTDNNVLLRVCKNKNTTQSQHPERINRSRSVRRLRLTNNYFTAIFSCTTTVRLDTLLNDCSNHFYQNKQVHSTIVVSPQTLCSHLTCVSCVSWFYRYWPIYYHKQHSLIFFFRRCLQWRVADCAHCFSNNSCRSNDFGDYLGLTLTDKSVFFKTQTSPRHFGRLCNGTCS